MHGRLKVRSTAEQQEAKRIEREKKLKFYRKITSECLKKIELKEFEENGLKLTEDILMANPDVLTLWNLRRNILMNLKNLKTLDELDALYINELTVSELALRKNPKSYGSWQHRQWCLLNSTKLALKSNASNWQKELELCNKYLDLDERNFHCWSHRQFVVNKSKVASKSEEFKYTLDKISTNFSNYSSWHYRSKLIKDLYLCPEENGTQITKDFFEKEIELIENAVFTDPNDQSAWVYHRWLFNEYLHNNILKLIKVEGNTLELKFFENFNIIDKIISLKINTKTLEIKASNSSTSKSHESVKGDDLFTWSGEIDGSTSLSNQIKLEVSFKGVGDLHFILEKCQKDSKSFHYESLFIWDFDENVFKKHINNLKELSELEADKNKWVLVTLVYLMSLRDYKLYEECIQNYFSLLINHVDCTRKQYYEDWKEKISTNNL